MKGVMVELSTPGGLIFAGIAKSINLRTDAGSIQIIPHKGSYLNVTNATQITLQTTEGPCIFEIENAVAGLKGHKFTVLAERICRVEQEAISDLTF